MPLLSVIIPVYNEVRTIKEIIKKIDSVKIDKEMVVVDDGSTDGTDRILRELNYPNLKVIHHSSNRGKGVALLTGLAHTEGEIVIIQDADLEYNPQDYLKLIKEFNASQADLILGVRFTEEYKGLLIPRLGNYVLTNLFNFLFFTTLNDVMSCYKLAKRQTFKNLNLKAKGFEIEIEIMAKAIKNGLKIKQVPIDYYPRSYSEGKKIKWLDGIYAVLTIFRYRFGA
ncbi:MAG: glycosyltransferase family 2 protein [Candidatus Omnitrophica bacterium]|nr:glycosyltransferase family 2 protein [Candidatus Omnitrophota bacterium]